MNISKEASIETIRMLPNSCSIDDIIYEINLVAQVLERHKDVEEGRIISTEKLLRKVNEWAI